MQADIKTRDGKNLEVKALVDSGCTHTGIDEQLVKKKKIQTKAIDFSFEVFNADGTKNGEVTKVAPLEVEINGHKETLEAAVTDLAGTDMFLGMTGWSNTIQKSIGKTALSSSQDAQATAL